MKLSKWAKEHGIHYMTAYRWFHNGTLPVKAIQTETGTILVTENTINPQVSLMNENKLCYIYCRVSSHDKKADLNRQVERCNEFCLKNGWQVVSITKEIASGMNDNRPKLNKLLEQNPKRIVVEHKDRLTRFGFNYFNLMLPKLGCELVVINQEQEEEHDLMKDLISVVISFCCRLYGLRKGYTKAQKIKKEIHSSCD